MHERSRGFLIAVAAAIGGFVATMAASIVKAIWQFEVERAWDTTVKAIVRDGLGWPQVATMLEAANGSFWAGVFLTLAVWGGLEPKAPKAGPTTSISTEASQPRRNTSGASATAPLSLDPPGRVVLLGTSP
jgi:hypothetical protein